MAALCREARSAILAKLQEPDLETPNESQ
jgi:hypothetical protein